MHKTHKAALLLGSILPDLFVYTYLEGHTWEATFDKIINHMEVLEEKGRGGCFSYLKLGCISALCRRLFYLSTQYSF